VTSSAIVRSACGGGRDLDRRLAIPTASGVDFDFGGILQHLRRGVDPPFIRRHAGTLGANFRGVVAPFFGAIVIIFSILVGFLASDVWDRNRRAAATVRGDHALAATLGAPHVAIDRAIRAYATAVVNKEWRRMENGEAAPEAEAAQDELLETVAQSDFAVAGSAALDRLLLRPEG